MVAVFFFFFFFFLHFYSNFFVGLGRVCVCYPFIGVGGSDFVDLRRVRLGLGSVMWCLVIVSGSVVGWV